MQGGAASFVAQQLDNRLREHLKMRNNLLNEGTTGLSASLSRPLLCLFDRNFELSVVSCRLLRHNLWPMHGHARQMSCASQTADLKDCGLHDICLPENACLQLAVWAAHIEKTRPHHAASVSGVLKFSLCALLGAASCKGRHCFSSPSVSCLAVFGRSFYICSGHACYCQGPQVMSSGHVGMYFLCCRRYSTPGPTSRWCRTSWA